MSDEHQAAFDVYTHRLIAWARGDDRVLGVLLLGSGADRARIDAWSDHDIAVIAHPEAVEELRGTTAWIPDAQSLVAVGREWHDGFKALFSDGRVIEYAVTDLAGLAAFPIAAAHIAYDAGGVVDAVGQARALTRPRSVSDAPATAAVLLVQLVVGVGRLRRGERLSGANVIRSEAAASLIDLIVQVRHPGRARPDPFDVWRRFEHVEPEAAAALDAVLARPAEEAALGILSLAEALLEKAWAGGPAAGARAVRGVLEGAGMPARA